jgi:hypothetical protein
VHADGIEGTGVLAQPACGAEFLIHLYRAVFIGAERILRAGFDAKLSVTLQADRRYG